MQLKIKQHRFTVLLAALSAKFLLIPLIQTLFPGSGARFLELLSGSLFVLILLSALFAVSRTRITIGISAGFVLTSILLDVVYLTHPSPILEEFSYAGDIAFLIWCVILIVYRMFKIQQATFDNIAAALCAYLLMGLAWGLLYALIERMHPGSFIGPSFDGGGLTLMQDKHTAIYFSLITISTLGLGDIVPATASLRLLVAGEAVMGQLYLAVLVARLVGLHLSGASRAAVRTPE